MEHTFNKGVVRMSCDKNKQTCQGQTTYEQSQCSRNGLSDYLIIKSMLGEIKGFGLNDGRVIKRISQKSMRNLLLSLVTLR